MQVKLINYTPNPDETVAAAARLCYSPLGAEKLMENFSPGEVEKFLVNYWNWDIYLRWSIFLLPLLLRV